MPWVPIPDPTPEELADSRKRFRKKPRFLVDEALGIEVARFLRDESFNVKYVGEVGLEHRDDTEVFAFARRDDRLLLTHDKDFLNDRRFPPQGSPGVVVLAGGDGDQQAMATSLVMLLTIVAPLPEFYRGTKVTITEAGEVRIRRRNDATGRAEEKRYRVQRNGPVLIWVNEQGT